MGGSHSCPGNTGEIKTGKRRKSAIDARDARPQDVPEPARNDRMHFRLGSRTSGLARQDWPRFLCWPAAGAKFGAGTRSGKGFRQRAENFSAERRTIRRRQIIARAKFPIEVLDRDRRHPSCTADKIRNSVPEKSLLYRLKPLYPSAPVGLAT
jgi:hypothetical protein